MPTDTVAIMMPKSMTFKAGPSASYAPVTEETTAQTYVARGVEPSQPLDFTISGTGQMPRDTRRAGYGWRRWGGDERRFCARGAGGAAAGSAASDTRPGGGLGTPLDPEGTNDPWAKYKWWILGGLGLAMAVWRGDHVQEWTRQKWLVLPVWGRLGAGAVVAGPIGAGAIVAGPTSLLAAMKEELFALETDRLQGRLSESEYVEQKAALEVVLRRALARGEGADRTSKVAGPVA